MSDSENTWNNRTDTEVLLLCRGSSNSKQLWYLHLHTLSRCLIVEQAACTKTHLLSSFFQELTSFCRSNEMKTNINGSPVCVCARARRHYMQRSLVSYQWQSLRKCESVCLQFSQKEPWQCLDNWEKWVSVQLSRREKQPSATFIHTDILNVHVHVCAFMNAEMHDWVKTQNIQLQSAKVVNSWFLCVSFLVTDM